MATGNKVACIVFTGRATLYVARSVGLAPVINPYMHLIGTWQIVGICNLEVCHIRADIIAFILCGVAT